MHVQIVPAWVDINNGIFRLSTSVKWDVQGEGQLSIDQWYFIIANHQGWMDIAVLQKVFNRKIPVLKFFMKQELLWTLPFASWVCWVLDFPFVKRYSKSYLKKHPEKRGENIKTAKRSCEKFKDWPTAIVNYLEGGRFRPDRKISQKSPYQHLLKPKAGGFALTLYLLGDQIKNLIDVTIVYPEQKSSILDLMFGRIKKL
jgi:1-acyl-sn-glycerol-3-phosphate acyltransferase